MMHIPPYHAKAYLSGSSGCEPTEKGSHVEASHCWIGRGESGNETRVFRSRGAGQSFVIDVAVLAQHEHRQCCLADLGAGFRCLLSASAVDSARLSARDHDPDCHRRTARRHDRPATALAWRNCLVRSGFDPVRRSAHALAANRRTRAARPRRGQHDGPYPRLCRPLLFRRKRPAALWGCWERCRQSAPRSVPRLAAF